MATINHKNLEFGARFREARRFANLTQQKLADMVGISQAAIHKLEAGHFQSSRNTVPIAIACKVNPVWLETGHGTLETHDSPKSNLSMNSKTEGIKNHLMLMEKQLNQTIMELTEVRNHIRRLQNRSQPRQKKPESQTT